MRSIMETEEEIADHIEELRSRKMADLKAAREAYRSWALRDTKELTGTLFEDRLTALQAVVKAADADLRQFNAEHPRRPSGQIDV